MEKYVIGVLARLHFREKRKTAIADREGKKKLKKFRFSVPPCFVQRMAVYNIKSFHNFNIGVKKGGEREKNSRISAVGETDFKVLLLEF